jgi:nucleotide-binding universal stress UspA family protein
MTRLLIGYDGSEPARAAIAAAGALFGPVDATVAHVHPSPPTLAGAGLARAALPDTMIAEGIANLREQAEAEARRVTDEGVAFARSAGLRADPSVLWAVTPWRALRAAAAEADVIVCGTAGEGPLERAVLGSTASSLLHHLDRPLLVVPAGTGAAGGPVFVGFDGSDGARAALRFAAEHVSGAPLVIAHAVDSRSGEPEEGVAAEGVAFARALGLDARALSPVGGRSAWRTLLAAAQEHDATGLLVGSRGRGAVASTVLGSVASGLVHAAALPVLVVPDTWHDAVHAAAAAHQP